MGPLRWILLVLGIALIAAIYWSGRRREREREETLLQRARRDDPEPAAGSPPDAGVEKAPADAEEAPAEPELDVGAFDPDELSAELRDVDRLLDRERERPGAAPADAGGHGGAGGGTAAPADRGAAAERPADERVVVVYVVAPHGERLVGARLAEAFARRGLEHGELDIFHARDGEGGTIYSVANGVEPGTFEPATMDTLSTPGVALFLRLPGPPSAQDAFDRMVTDARALAEELEARVLDGRHSTLTRQTEQHLRDEMRELDLRRGRKRP